MDFSRLNARKPCQDVRKHDVDVIWTCCRPPDSWKKGLRQKRHLLELFNATGVQPGNVGV